MKLQTCRSVSGSGFGRWLAAVGRLGLKGLKFAAGRCTEDLEASLTTKRGFRICDTL